MASLMPKARELKTYLITNYKNLNDPLNMPKRKPKTIGKLKKELQILVNKYCKLRDCTDGGAICISCKKWTAVEKLHGGHFLASTYSATRFDERNINAQCGFSCNLSKSGNIHEYRVGMIEKYGLEVVEELENKRLDEVKWSLPKLREDIALYKEKLKELNS